MMIEFIVGAFCGVLVSSLAYLLAWSRINAKALSRLTDLREEYQKNVQRSKSVLQYAKSVSAMTHKTLADTARHSIGFARHATANKDEDLTDEEYVELVYNRLIGAPAPGKTSLFYDKWDPKSGKRWYDIS